MHRSRAFLVSQWRTTSRPYFSVVYGTEIEIFLTNRYGHRTEADFNREIAQAGILCAFCTSAEQ